VKTVYRKFCSNNEKELDLLLLLLVYLTILYQLNRLCSAEKWITANDELEE
jgi:hypothetical protein